MPIEYKKKVACLRGVVAVEEAERGRCYLRELARSPWLRRRCYGWSEVEGLIDGACNALAGFGDAVNDNVGPLRLDADHDHGSGRVKTQFSVVHQQDPIRGGRNVMHIVRNQYDSGTSPL